MAEEGFEAVEQHRANIRDERNERLSALYNAIYSQVPKLQAIQLKAEISGLYELEEVNKIIQIHKFLLKWLAKAMEEGHINDPIWQEDKAKIKDNFFEIGMALSADDFAKLVYLMNTYYNKEERGLKL